MALYSELPVFKAAYDLLLAIFRFTQGLNREYKFTIGEKLKQECMELVTNIYRANKTHNKSAFLDAARENTELIRLNFRILKDLNVIGVKRLVSINEKIELVMKGNMVNITTN